MRLQVVETFSELAEIENTWENFVQESFPHLCDSFIWQVNALQYYFPDSPFKVILFYEDKQLTGILPLSYNRSSFIKLPVRKYHFFEQGIGLSTALIQPSRLLECFRLLWQQLPRLLPSFHILKLTLSESQIVEMQPFLREIKQDGYTPLFINKSVLGLAINQGENFWDNVLNPKGRREFKRVENRLKIQLDFSIIQPEPGNIADNFDQYWQRFNKLYRQSWKQQSHRSISTRSSENGFFHTLFKQYAEKGQLHISFLCTHDTDIASNWWINHRKVFYGLQTVFNDAYKQYAPGIYLIQKDLMALMEKGNTQFDFMGCQSYKKKFSNAESTYYDLYILTNSLYGKLLNLFRTRSKTNFEVFE